MKTVLDWLMTPYPTEGNGLALWAWLFLAAILLTQGIWLFRDARKRGAWYWFWGLWGCIQAPTPLLVYWLTVRGGARLIRTWFRRFKRNRT
ncbi:sigmaY antisigma factor component [Gorillibacterium sp. CAU 1737]|uniref:sigmaY antisigma factor component n=1 Tax=Gorillibacterium sp. CAU 1737 TaxID=3140362 RepID=UPI003260C9C4